METLVRWIIPLLSAGANAGFYISWIISRRAAIKREGEREWKFNAMWSEYAAKHGIPKNGETTT